MRLHLTVFLKLFKEVPRVAGLNPRSGLSPESRACPRATSKAAPSVEAHHRSVVPDIGRNSRKKAKKTLKI